MEIERFEEIQQEFKARAQKALYCNVATVDPRGRPRSRVMHLVWDGPTGWVIIDPASHKTKHLTGNPHVSIAYLSDPMKPVYVECTAAWVTDRDENLRIWELHKTLPPPMGLILRPIMGQSTINITASFDLHHGGWSWGNYGSKA